MLEILRDRTYRHLFAAQVVALLGTGLARLDHLDHRAQMPVGAFQPGDQGGVGCMEMRFCHRQRLSPPRG